MTTHLANERCLVYVKLYWDEHIIMAERVALFICPHYVFMGDKCDVIYLRKLQKIISVNYYRNKDASGDRHDEYNYDDVKF